MGVGVSVKVPMCVFMKGEGVHFRACFAYVREKNFRITYMKLLFEKVAVENAYNEKKMSNTYSYYHMATSYHHISVRLQVK